MSPAQRHYEVVKAAAYYTNRAPGWVLLGNGHVVMHDTKREVDRLYHTLSGNAPRKT